MLKFVYVLMGHMAYCMNKITYFTYERRRCHVKGGLLTIICLVVSYCKTLSLSSVQNSCRISHAVTV